VGYRTPAYATSLGHVLLANLPPAQREAFLSRAPFPKYTSKTYSLASELRRAFKRICKDDYASTRDQFEYGVFGIAVPVRTAYGQVVAAIGCSAEANRVDMDTFVTTRLPRLREVATELSRAFERTPALVHSIQSTCQIRPT
jgi:IclR family transcriptional regulator, pca regulon regulatory protein